MPPGFGFNDTKARHLYAQAKTAAGTTADDPRAGSSLASAQAGFLNPDAVVAMLELPPKAKVADLGCGEGRYSIALAKKVGVQGRVFAVDVQQGLLSRLRSQAEAAGLHNIEYIWGDLERPRGSKIADALVDLVLVANTLFLVENKLAFLTEAARICKPGGRLVVIDWLDSFRGLGPRPEMVVSPEEARRLAESVGFRFLQELPRAAHHYILVFQKPSGESTPVVQ